MMKEIRILSGLHRGAKLKLNPGVWYIGRDENADVQISDWQHATLALEIDSAGDASVRPEAAEGLRTQLIDMQPFIFDGIVLCIGDVGATWQPEHVLLQKLKPAAEVNTPDHLELGQWSDVSTSTAVAVRNTPPKRWLMFATVLLTIGVSGTTLLLGKPSRASVLPETTSVLRHVRDGLLRLHLNELDALPEGDLIVVRGTVSSSADVFAVRKMLDAVLPKKTVLNVMTVNDVIANIQESLHDTNLTVSYAGQGKFVISGAARNVQAVQATVKQMASDFGAGVKDIRLDITAAPRTWAVADNDSALSIDSLQYMQALDGTKRFPVIQED